MTQEGTTRFHSHVFLGEGHDKSERKTWAVIWLCGAMMVAEIVGGLLFGSIALVADGMHMSTHAGALAAGGARLYLRPQSRRRSASARESSAILPASPAPSFWR
jgi:Co/Zn/Cd efflux system component